MEHAAHYWQKRNDGRIICTLCPRSCILKDGERGYCYVRRAKNGIMQSESYGQICGVACDPMEKKPLYHFFPGTKILSFGTIGCNMGCSFCQNWHLSKPRDHLASVQPIDPATLVESAHNSGCGSIAFTYNDPVVFAEFAMDVARHARSSGLKTVAVTAGYIQPAARSDFFALMDAANVDLKAIRREFYQKHCSANLEAILNTLRYLSRETNVWLEITNLLIPGENDSPEEIGELCDFVARELGRTVPLHFSAFHPDFRMTDKSTTPASTLLSAQKIAHECGLQHVYLGNIRGTPNHTMCRGCGATLIERHDYNTMITGLGPHGSCLICGQALAGIYS